MNPSPLARDHRFAGAGAAREYIVNRDVDVMLAVGTSFNEWVTSGWDRRMLPSRALIQVDIEPDEIGKNFYAQCGVAGDAKVVLRELIYELRRQMAGRGERRGKSPRRKSGCCRTDSCRERLAGQPAVQTAAAVVRSRKKPSRRYHLFRGQRQQHGMGHQLPAHEKAVQLLCRHGFCVHGLCRSRACRG